MFIHSYPYSDNHEINLDWVIQQTEAMVASNRELIQEVQTSKEAFINQTENFEAALNRQTAAMESLVNSISEYIGLIVDFDPSDVYDIEFLGWAVPRRCPVKNYIDTNGNFHQRVGRVDLSTLSWAKPDVSLFTANVPGKALSQLGLFCYKYPYNGPKGFFVADKNVSDWTSPETYKTLICIKDTDYDVISTFTASLNGVYLYYELETEVIYKVGEELPFRSSTASPNSVRLNSVRLNSEPIEVETDSFTLEPETVIEVEAEPIVEP